MSSTGQESDVLPSSPLIATLHHRLRDPSIVPRFERGRVGKVSSCLLISPRWVLRGAGDTRAAGLAAVGHESTSARQSDGHFEEVDIDFAKVNAIPHRNYIDLRLEQNKLFADDRFRQYQQIYAKWSKDFQRNERTNFGSHDRGIEKQRKQQLDMIETCLKEGLAAYPDHVELLEAQTNLSQKIGTSRSTSDLVMVLPSNQAPVSTSAQVELSSQLENLTTEMSVQHNLLHPSQKKGAEGRAQAAIRDAMLERSFMIGSGTTAVTGDEYNLLPDEDDDLDRTLNKVNLPLKLNHKIDTASLESCHSSSEDSPSSDFNRKRKRKRKHDHRKHKRDKKKHHSHKKKRKHRRSSYSRDSDSRNSEEDARRRDRQRHFRSGSPSASGSVSKSQNKSE